MTKTYKINQSSCRNKLAYLTEAQAAEQARMLSQYQYEIFIGYECDVCGYYHLGHPGKRKGVGKKS